MKDPNEAIQELLDAESFGSVVTFVAGPAIGQKAVIDSNGTLLAGSLPDAVAEDVFEDARTLMTHEQHRALDYGEHSVFIETLAPPPDLLIFGAVHIGQALSSFATQMGYRVTVVDSRAPFVTDERFPTAARLLIGWPTRSDGSADDGPAHLGGGALPRPAARDPAPRSGAEGRYPLHRGDGQPADTPAPGRASSGARLRRCRHRPGSTHRSVSISAPRPLRRWPCRSSPR